MTSTNVDTHANTPVRPGISAAILPQFLAPSLITKVLRCASSSAVQASLFPPCRQRMRAFSGVLVSGIFISAPQTPRYTHTSCPRYIHTPGYSEPGAPLEKLGRRAKGVAQFAFCGTKVYDMESDSKDATHGARNITLTTCRGFHFTELSEELFLTCSTMQMPDTVRTI